MTVIRTAYAGVLAAVNILAADYIRLSYCDFGMFCWVILVHVFVNFVYHHFDF